MRKILIAGAFILAVSQYACVHHHHRHDTGPDQMGEPPPQHHPEHDRMQKQPHNHPEQ